MDAVPDHGDGVAAAKLKPPPLHLTMREWPRAAVTVVRLMGARRRLDGAARGDGRPVLILPGLFNSDRSNFVLRGFLDRLGYRAYRWDLGRNLGARTIGADAGRLIARIEIIATEARAPVTLVGISLGGIMARLIAHRRPDLVNEVITVSAPYAAHPRATRVWRAFEWITGERVDDDQVTLRRHEIAQPLIVPTTAIWSASDGMVNGYACHDRHCRTIEVTSGHLGVQLNPDVLLAIAAVLAGDQRSESSPAR